MMDVNRVPIARMCHCCVFVPATSRARSPDEAIEKYRFTIRNHLENTPIRWFAHGAGYPGQMGGVRLNRVIL